MREDLVPAEEARRLILQEARALDEEMIAIGDAAGRVLVRDLEARRTQPPFPASAMDGYAVAHQDLSDLPASLKVVGTAAAGRPFEGGLGQGEAVRIFTGAPVPEGADTIVIQENVRRLDERVEISSEVEKGKFVRPAGLDFRTGDILLQAGDILDPQRLSLAAAMNHDKVPVCHRPVVALLATGDELVPPGNELSPGQIIASNTYGLAAIVETAGGIVRNFGIIPDREAELREAFRKALAEGVDVILTTGGASVGDHDLVLPVMQAIGGAMAFKKIAMRPGKPMLAGRLDHQGRTVHLLGLAGNPVSSIVAGHIFVRPLVAAMAGRPLEETDPVDALLGRDLPENDEREEYMRATLETGPGGRLVATPFEKQDSSMLANLARADGLLIRPAHAVPARKGDPCRVLPLRARR